MSHERDTVVLADDHAIVREGIATLCPSHSLKILEQCADGPVAYEAILRLQPELAILDLHMPGITGIEVVRRLRASECDTKLLVLSISRDAGLVMEVLRSGADAHLLKDGPLATPAGCDQLCA